MNISDWTYNQELRGRCTFSLEEVRSSFPDKTESCIRSALSRMVATGTIKSVYRGFYVIIPVQYQLKGNVPVTYYVDDLLRWLGRNYYVGLLSAASIYGASHQRAMRTQVVIDGAQLSTIAKDSPIDFVLRQRIPDDLLIPKNGEMGVIMYSSPELTTVDLVQYAQHVGGYQRAATVLAELLDEVDIEKMADVIPYVTTATMQRLGALLDLVLYEQEKADALFRIIKEADCVRKSILLSNAHPKNLSAESNRWHVNMNIDIEIDEL